MGAIWMKPANSNILIFSSSRPRNHQPLPLERLDCLFSYRNSKLSKCMFIINKNNTQVYFNTRCTTPRIIL